MDQQMGKVIIYPPHNDVILKSLLERVERLENPRKDVIRPPTYREYRIEDFFKKVVKNEVNNV